MSPPMAFKALSARLGSDPLQVQGPGGNTSWKADGTMWIKASGTELADAMGRDIFVPVDLARARAEAQGEGDGTCRSAVLSGDLRPSIETTFHALFEDRCVAHTHSVAVLAHCISPEGRAAMADLLPMPHAVVPYAMPGRPLTEAIRAGVGDERVVILSNHGLIVRGDDADVVSDTLAAVEDALRRNPAPETQGAAPDGFEAVATALLPWRNAVLGGSYWPDHVVFLGPALPGEPEEGRPAVLTDGGAAIRDGATAVQRAMLRCLSDVFGRVDPDWTPAPIGADAEAALLGWDAEKYRQALAARGSE